MPQSHSDHSSIFDVVIAGAGPVGLFLACELRLFGLSVLVLEQAHDPHSPLKRLPFGMRGLNAPTLDALDRRGLLDALIAAHEAARQPAPAAHWMQQARRPAGHFAGIAFYRDQIDASKWAYRLPGPAGTTMAVALETLETVLVQRAVAMGVQILRGLSVETFVEAAPEVAVHAGGRVFRGRWLVGCDGGRSAVRKAGGFAFSGTDPEFTGYSVEVELADSQALQPGRHYTPTGMFTFAEPGTIAMVDFDGGACHRREPLTLEHVQAVVRRISGVDVIVKRLLLATTWTDRAFQATTYRRGRVLLAGDAAHIHSPLGGQGLNLGLADAMNLGWKLAATIRGEAPETLLDSYERERHPAGARVLDWSRAQVALMRPTPATRALADIIGDLMDTRDGATYFAGRVWGVEPACDADDAALGHPLTGRGTPDFEFVDGRRVGALLREGRALLLDFERCAVLETLAERWRERVSYVAGDVRERLGMSAVLVRPDGIVAWASAGEPDAGEAEHAFERWFGHPGDTLNRR
ncbi:FAD-dependent monooxygenase [Burkholderia sp. Ax-1719]|uniref:FAD-dependent monooxygenase n=1 Tax=Burkholderia sp. Ax-1719 TaxID=2608334 RepID=UPI001421E711|nr:FAD-dependent monooxygenase [Burkholderia sp. Ax-1719]NIE64200.1 FAD-dependent oxidoreductase [Burkholderia sp. Ax-1719]